MIPQALLYSFKYRDKCHSPEFCHGECDAMSEEFMEHVKPHGYEGYLLGLDGPTREPDLGYKYWGGKEFITHYVAYFPALNLAYDWTARQFWEAAAIPMILTPTHLKHLWGQVMYGYDGRADFDPNWLPNS